MFLDLLWYASKGMTKETTFSFRSDCCAVQLALCIFPVGSVVLCFMSLFALPLVAFLRSLTLVFATSAIILILHKVGFLSILAFTFPVLAFFSLFKLARVSAFSAVLLVLLKVRRLSIRTFAVSTHACFSLLNFALVLAFSAVVFVRLKVGFVSFRTLTTSVLTCLSSRFVALVSATSAVVVIVVKIQMLAFSAAEHRLVGRAFALPMIACLSFLARVSALAAVVNVLRKVGFLSVRAFASTTHALFSLVDVALVSAS